MFRKRPKGLKCIHSIKETTPSPKESAIKEQKEQLLDGIKGRDSNLFHGSEGRAKVDVDDLAGKQTQASRLEVLHRRQRAQGKHRVLEKEEQIEFR